MNNLNQDFTTLEYLARGTERQRSAYETLSKLKIMDVLHGYDPILVGTIPIHIDLPDSDLDIICEVHDFNGFKQWMVSEFGDLQDFRCVTRTVDGIRRIVANFRFQGWPIEIFGQPVPTKEQNGYRHMLIEHRILTILGDEGLSAIRELKSRGLKTEPAFAKLLKLEGDAYARLLEMVHWKEAEWIDFTEAWMGPKRAFPN
ncbi:DUF4269 domain-containing protein [Paenibacillus sabinae]|uniref:Uncharacterized protein n=1 Tax=Paenibacillus sabinae T27 TaxID=1268072 RepID=X5A5G7_9BACL|nr:DUF4269 domain-containing protein [Paenibacillus sabinae]AHV99523.1 hypothetical protein PSAB_23180 [Paenibacillus sabinae T27]